MAFVKWLFVAFLAFAEISNAKEWVPSITRTTIKNSFDIQAFDDSTVLLRLENEKILITTDNGANWKPVSGINEDIVWYDIDEYYKDTRAIALSATTEKCFVTEDKGKTWTTIDLSSIDKKKSNENFMASCYLTSHPTNKNVFKLHCMSCDQSEMLSKRANNDEDEDDDDDDNSKHKNQKSSDSHKHHQNNDNKDDDKKDDNKKNPWHYVPPKCHGRQYISNNYGKTFTLVSPPSGFDQSEDLIYDDVECSFALSSAKSKLVTDESTMICNYQSSKSSNDAAGIQIAATEFFVSTNWGKSNKVVDTFKNQYVEHFEVLENHILVATREDKYNENSNKRIWVSNDVSTFEEAYLPTQLRYSLTGSIQEDGTGRIILPVVRTEQNEKSGHNRDPGQGVTEILISDSTGLKFEQVDWGLGNNQGFMYLIIPDFLKGTMLGSFLTVSNRSPTGEYQILRQSQSKISTNNGITWSNLKIVDPKNREKYPCNIDDVNTCSLHTLAALENTKVPSAGIMMAVGVVGDGNNISWEEAKTFISRDSGVTWSEAFDFPTLYTMGDLGNILIAVPYKGDEDEELESEIYYSLDQGRTWSEYQLEYSIFPIELLPTTPDGSGLTFILNGIPVNDPESDQPLNLEAQNLLYTMDFSGAFDNKKCGPDDMETFKLNNGERVNGAVYSFQRRKQDSQCLVKMIFDNLSLNEEPCQECTDDDYECAFEFAKNENNECVINKKLLGLSNTCSTSNKPVIKLAPKQLRKSSKCKKPMEITKVDVTCETGVSPGEGKIAVTEHDLGSTIISYKYFDTSSSDSLIITTKDKSVYISNDGGQTIKKFDNNGDTIVEIVFNPYFGTNAYLFGSSGKLYITNDRGNTFTETQLASSRHLGFPIEFNAKDVNQFIYYAGKNCESLYDPDCHSVAYITKDGGESFEEMLDDALHCEFAGSIFKNPNHENLIICQTKGAMFQRKLVSSTDYFSKETKVEFENIIGYMTTGEFMVIAVPYEKNELRAYTTIDGKEYAEASFPKNINVDKQESFTVLGSESGSIFLQLATSLDPGAEFGPLLKSNSNGTSFVTLERAVNRNYFGFADFEKVNGLEGIILINVIDNRDDVFNNGATKKLKSKITFNDGSDWSYITPPVKDIDGKAYSCKKQSLEDCSLHLHGFTEHKDRRDTFGSGSAIGMMFGVGNVGSELLPLEESSTFFTTNGGLTWTEVKKGAYQWEYGDHGGILVLVPEGERTDSITYSTDFGKTWSDFKFSESEVIVNDIVTVPQDSAMTFMLIIQPVASRHDASKIVTIDFTRQFERQCQLDMSTSNKDFAYFPIEALEGECLFGHQAEYLKKTSSDCYVGNYPVSNSIRIVKNCTCTRKDFECDYNYYKASDGTCKLVDGLDRKDPSEVCKANPDLVEYFEPSGYRKIPLSTCEGGLKLDVKDNVKPCPGKGKEFQKEHGISGGSFFLLWFVPFAVVAGISWIVYDRGIRRNGGFARFGEIRLGDDDLIENSETDRMVNTILRSLFSGSSALYSTYRSGKRMVSEGVFRIRERMAGRRVPTYSSLLHDQFLDDADDLLAGHDEDASDLENFLNNNGDFSIDGDDDVIVEPFRDEPEGQEDGIPQQS